MAERTTLYHHASAAETTTFSTPDILFDQDSIELLLNVTAIGGTPSMVVTVEGKDADGAYFAVYTSAAITGVSKLAVSVGPETPNPAAIPAVFRLSFTIGGGTPSLTFTAVVYAGRIAQ